VRAFADMPRDMAKQSSFRPEVTAEELNKRSRGHLPGLVGMDVIEVAEGRLRGRLALRPDLLAPNGFLHAATVIALADTLCGYGCVAHLPEGAKGFTTIELKSNFLGTLLEGALACEATPVHLGRNTQVWDAVVTDASKGRRLALFRCTQIVLW
jgi:1,4-dihydroxy-2-naphthoyl-CoA hydrolase